MILENILITFLVVAGLLSVLGLARSAAEVWARLSCDERLAIGLLLLVSAAVFVGVTIVRGS